MHYTAQIERLIYLKLLTTRMILKETIQKAIVSQKEAFNWTDKAISRQLIGQIKVQNKFAIIISGIRRSGKSTLMRTLAKKNKTFYYASFEDPRLAGFELQDFERLEEVFHDVCGDSHFFFFDEIQLVDKWEMYIRKLLDQEKYVVITGSNASLLSKELGTKLTGRNLRYELFPFSYAEFLLFSGEKKGVESFNKYLISGGFPEYLQLRDPKILQDLLIDALYRDIAIRHKIRNVKQLRELAIFLITNATKEFSYNQLRILFNFGSTNSISQFLSFLEESYLLFMLPKFDYSLKKQIVNPKKIYVVDNGLIVHNSKTFSDDYGKLLENLVFISLKSRQKDLFYFKGKRECDFLCRKGSQITEAYQVCYTLNDFNKEREIGGLVEALQQFKLKEGIILTLNQSDYLNVEGKKIIITPLWKWLLTEAVA